MPAADTIKVRFESDGVHFPAPGASAAAWLSNPYQLDPESTELGARLAQLALEGVGDVREHEFLLQWSDLYLVLDHPDFGQHRAALLIPPESPARPRIASRGALIDPDFAILIDGWLDPQGRPLQPAPKFRGRLLESGQNTGLLPAPVHHLLEQLERFHATPVQDRTQSFKEQAFGRIRQLASTSGCPLSDYVARTIVLTPDRLRLAMERREVGEDQTIEVIPGFDEAPAQWLNQFDRLGARSYIVRGKGNAESFCSSAHGAGRRMSRTAAEKHFTEADLEMQTAGVICRKDKGVLDEIPGAYKDIDQVMANQRDLTEILHTLKQVVCVKG